MNERMESRGSNSIRLPIETYFFVTPRLHSIFLFFCETLSNEIQLLEKRFRQAILTLPIRTSDLEKESMKVVLIRQGNTAAVLISCKKSGYLNTLLRLNLRS